MIREIFSDKNNVLSSKRIFGAALVVAGATFNALGMGDPATNEVMLWAGVASLGVGTLETKVAK